MINANGLLVSSFSEIPTELIQQLHTELSIAEQIRYQNGKILFWEQHYFRMLANLRRHRLGIPMDFTMEYLEAEVNKLLNIESPPLNCALVRIQFISHQEGVAFLISVSATKALDQIAPLQKYSLDLFKEVGIQASELSNLSTTNTTLFTIGKRYAAENGLDDCIVLNDQKNLVETLQGSLYLFQEDKILTPHLASGCQNFAFRTVFNEWLESHLQEKELVEQALNPYELQKSKELLVLSLEKGGQSITQYRKTFYKTEASQKIYRTFLNQLH